MDKKHFLVVWGYFAVYESEVPEMEDPRLIDAETPDGAIALYPAKVGRGQAYVVGTVEDEELDGIKMLSTVVTPMAAHPYFCSWTSALGGKLSGPYKRHVNTLYLEWKLADGFGQVDGETRKKAISEDDTLRLIQELQNLREFKKNAQECLEKEYSKLYDSGVVSSMTASRVDGTFSFTLKDTPVREELRVTNHWLRYYRDKYLATLTDEERNPPPESQSTT